jgi:uncharacterized protein (DUF433 family)
MERKFYGQRIVRDPGIWGGEATPRGARVLLRAVLASLVPKAILNRRSLSLFRR